MGNIGIVPIHIHYITSTCTRTTSSEVSNCVGIWYYFHKNFPPLHQTWADSVLCVLIYFFSEIPYHVSFFTQETLVIYTFIIIIKIPFSSRVSSWHCESKIASIAGFFTYKYKSPKLYNVSHGLSILSHGLCQYLAVRILYGWAFMCIEVMTPTQWVHYNEYRQCNEEALFYYVNHTALIFSAHKGNVISVKQYHQPGWLWTNFKQTFL